MTEASCAQMPPRLFGDKGTKSLGFHESWEGIQCFISAIYTS